MPDDITTIEASLEHSDNDVPFLLLPVRLETRFAETVTGARELLIRVYPDDVFVDTHEPELTVAEVAAGRAYWTAAWAQQPSSWDDDAARQLVAEHVPERAAWTAMATRPTNVGSGDAAPQFADVAARDLPWTRAAHTTMLPDRWVAWGRLLGDTIGPVVGNPIAEQVVLGPNPDPNAVPSDLLDVLDADAAWIVDFDIAEAQGMALRLPLTGSSSRGLNAVFVAGIKTVTDGDGAARIADLLSAHRYTDGLALVPQGTPTNNTTDAPAGFARGADPLAPLRVALGDPSYTPVAAGASNTDGDGATATDGQRLAEALGLEPDAFARTEQGGLTGARNATAMATLLWPTTWGYYLEQMMGDSVTPQQRAAASRHAVPWVQARGPLPALRTGTMPYGILPCTPFDRWQAATDEIEAVFERTLVDILNRVLPFWRDAVGRVARAGTGDPEATIVALLGLQPSSVSYGVRSLLGGIYWWNLMRFGSDNTGLDGHWEQHVQGTAATLQAAGFSAIDPPLGRMIFAGPRFSWSAPLVQSGPLSEDAPLTVDYLNVIRSATLEQLRNEQYTVSVPERPLLYALTRHAALRTYVDTAIGILATRGLVEPTAARDLELVQVTGDAHTTPFEQLNVAVPDLTGQVPLQFFIAQPDVPPRAELVDVRAFNAAIDHLATVPTAELERLLTETLDTASHRLDAWITSLATKRLAAMRSRRPKGLLVGAYGWLENAHPSRPPRPPTPANEPAADPGSGGYLLTPSVDQATAAAVLRSAYLTHADALNAERVAIDLSSRRVRRALALLDGVRDGYPLGELLGRRFERDLHDAHRAPGDPELDQYVAPLRRLYPLAATTDTAVAGDATTDVPTAVVVHGLRLGDAHRVGAIPFGDQDLPGFGTPEHTAIEALLDGLDDDVDAVADILLAEGVYQATRGNHERAAQSLDAAAGVGAPPEPEFVTTPRGGVAVTHRFAVVLQAAATAGAAGAGWSATPRAQAEPALDAWVGRVLGDPRDIRCRVTFGADPAADPVTVSLADLGLAPLDLVLLDGVERTTAGAGDLAERLVAAASPGHAATGGATLLLAEDPTWPPAVRSVVEVVELVLRLRALVIGARPLTPADVVLPQVAHTATGIDEVELRARAEGARDAAAAAVTALEAALGASTTDEAQLRAALEGAARFGVKGASAVIGADLAARAEAARVELTGRRDAASGALTNGDVVGSVHAVFDASFPVLPRFAAPNATELAAALAHPTLLDPADPDAPLRWMQQVARVRDGVQRFELASLLAEVAGTESPELRVAQLPHDSEVRWLGLPLEPDADAPAGRVSLVFHAPDGVDPSRLTGLFVDELIERIPHRDHTAGIAFHYDQPNARAPQTWLLAVPPVREPGGRWHWDDVAGSIESALDLAHLRAVDPEALAAVGHFLPAIVLAYNEEAKTVSTDLLQYVTIAEVQ